MIVAITCVGMNASHPEFRYLTKRESGNHSWMATNTNMFRKGVTKTKVTRNTEARHNKAASTNW